MSLLTILMYSLLTCSVRTLQAIEITIEPVRLACGKWQHEAEIAVNVMGRYGLVGKQIVKPWTAPTFNDPCASFDPFFFSHVLSFGRNRVVAVR